jgi:uncharacterized protein (TIGR02147 family)
MRSVFDYLDYRAYLKDAYEERKSERSFYSYRVMAQSLGMYPSNLFGILHGKGHLPTRCLPRAVEVLGLSGRAAEYFQLLVSQSRERSTKARADIMEKAIALRDVSRRSLEERELEYFGHWWTAVVRATLDLTAGRAEPEELASCLVPPVGAAEVRASVELLSELGLVKKASSGRLLPAEAHLTAGGKSKSIAVHAFQKQIQTLASESLDRFGPEERDVSTLTLSMGEQAFQEIRELLRECRRQIQKTVEESTSPDRVMHLSMAFFPAAHAPSRRP